MWINLIFSLTLSIPWGEEPVYTYVEDTTQFVGIQRPKAFFIGKLDSAGNFIPEMWWPGFRVGMPGSMPLHQLINDRRPGKIPVYEYRSGRLVKGELDKEGNFIPDLGSKVIDFKDYRYSKEAPIIYNLPGRFVPKEKKDQKK